MSISSSTVYQALSISALEFGRSEASPFPIGQLNPSVLNSFLPQIQRELEGEFTHQNDSRTRRDTIGYGYDFVKMEKNDFTRTTPPAFYQKLGDYICQYFGHDRVEFTNIILSRYEAGFHLEPHIDIHSSNTHSINSSNPGGNRFYFEENVYGLIVEPDATGHLYFVYDDQHTDPPLDLKPIYALEERPGTIFCLQGDYRKNPYFHGVTNVSNHRVSITFRRVVLL